MEILDKYSDLEKYILDKKGVTKDYKAEWDWDRFIIGGKMFVAFCGDGGEKPLITVKCYPATSLVLREEYKPDIFEGYYMNKVHWSSIHANGNVPIEVIKSMIDEGYDIVFNALSKKAQQGILGG